MSTGPVPLRLAEKEWKRLAEIVGLPDAAREQLEFILGDGKFYQEHEQTSLPPHAIKKELKKTLAQVEALLAGLQRCLANEGVLMALVSPPEGVSGGRWKAFWAFRDQIAGIQSLSRWLALAEQRTPASRRGNKTTGAYFVAKCVDLLLLEHLGYGLRRDAKNGDPGEDFLDACLTAIGATVSAATMIRRIALERSGKVPLEKS